MKVCGIFPALQAVLGMSVVSLSISTSVHAFEDPYNTQKETIFSRKSFETYQSERDGRPTKLVLGAGHIHNVTALPARLQPKQALRLKESPSGDFDYLKFTDYFTVSSERSEAFGADVVCDLYHTLCQEQVFGDQRWDLVLATRDSGMLDDVSIPGLLEHVQQGLKPDGRFIFPLYMSKDGYGTYKLGVRESFFEEETTSQFAKSLVHAHLSPSFYDVKSAKDYVVKGMTSLGYSSVTIEPSCEKMLGSILLDDIESRGYDLEWIKQRVRNYLSDWEKNAEFTGLKNDSVKTALLAVLEAIGTMTSIYEGPSILEEKVNRYFSECHKDPELSPVLLVDPIFEHLTLKELDYWVIAGKNNDHAIPQKSEL